MSIIIKVGDDDNNNNRYENKNVNNNNNDNDNNGDGDNSYNDDNDNNNDYNNTLINYHHDGYTIQEFTTSQKFILRARKMKWNSL